MRHVHLSDPSLPWEHGELSSMQELALAPHVSRRHVHDLGAGDLRLSVRLSRLGALTVTAVDCKAGEAGPTSCPGVRWVQSYLHEYRPRGPIEVAFVSWPPYVIADREVITGGIVRLCAAAPVVAYLGNNVDAVCGNPELWRHLGTREVLTHVPERRNTLIVYGRQNGRIPGQGLLPEEKAALYR